MVVPAHFPSAGVLIRDVKPAVLRMLIAKIAALVHEEGERWVPLTTAQSRKPLSSRSSHPSLLPVGVSDHTVHG